MVHLGGVGQLPPRLPVRSWLVDRTEQGLCLARVEVGLGLKLMLELILLLESLLLLLTRKLWLLWLELLLLGLEILEPL